MNIFHQTDVLTHQTVVEAVQRRDDGRFAIAVLENIVRPALDEQLRDHGHVLLAESVARICDVRDEQGRTWLTLDSPISRDPASGVPAILRVDERRRHALSRAHSLIHLFSAACRKLVEGYRSAGAKIADDAEMIELRFRSGMPLTQGQMNAVDRLTRSLLLRDLAITTEYLNPRGQAVQLNSSSGGQHAMDEGEVRVAHIDGLDHSPCSGSHVASTGAIGPYAVIDHRVDGVGNNVVNLRVQQAWTYWWG